MTDPASLITAIAALVAALGGVLAAVLAYRARRGVEENQAAITVIEGEVREVGKRIDGRLTELLESSSALARAEGIATGEQSQRDRQTGPQP